MAEQEKTYEIYEADLTGCNEVVLRPEKGTIDEEELNRWDERLSHYILEVEYELWREGACRHDDCADTDNLVYDRCDFYTISVKENVNALFRVDGMIRGVVFHVKGKDGISRYPFLFVGGGNEEKMTLIGGEESDWYHKCVHRLRVYYKENKEDIAKMNLSPVPLFLPFREWESE